jgi:hypothetical protein
MLGVWISKVDYEKLEQFLDKFSAGDSFLDQLKLHLLAMHADRRNRPDKARLETPADGRRTEESRVPVSQSARYKYIRKQ